jgi:hypothetical protein
MRLERTAVLILILTAIVSAGPNHAACQNLRIISTLFPRGTHSYIHTPGVEPSATGSSITEDFEGFFWALGSGHPVHGAGNDSGIFKAMGEGRDGWIQREAGYPATFNTSWASNRHIDNCIDDSDAETKCTTVLLTDQHNGTGYFAVLTSAADRGNYSFVQPGNAPIVLAPIPKPQIVSSTPQSSGEFQASVRLDGPTAGLYLAEGCSADILAGYRVYAMTVERSASPPADLWRTGVDTGGKWKLVDGGAAPGGQELAMADSTNVTLSCDPTKDVYLATTLVFDSGFETAHVSGASAPIRCDE